MPLIDVAQQSDEWLKMRIGMCTASRMSDVVKRLKRKTKDADKGEYSKAHYDYMMELVAERFTGRSADHYVTQYMEEGIENEPFARAAYELQCDDEVLPGGYAMHPTINWFGASPDSLIGQHGLLEIKCLKTINHLEILKSQTIPEEFLPQMLAEMSCAERQWCDFVSFDPRMPAGLKVFIQRLERDEKLISALEDEVRAFLAEVEEMVTRLKKSAHIASGAQDEGIVATYEGIVP